MRVSVSVRLSVMDWVSKTRRKEAVVEMMRAGDWRAVLAEFNTEQYREPLLLWIRPNLSCLEFLRAEGGRQYRNISGCQTTLSSTHLNQL